MMATEQKLRGDWNQVAGKVKEKYGEFTDDELVRVKGNAQHLIAMIQAKSGQAREQIEAFVHNLYENAGYQMNNAYETTSECVQSTGKAIQQGYEQVVDRAQAGYEYSTTVIAKRPTESVLVALGVGLVTGLAIGLSIAERRRPEPNWRNGWRG